MLQPTEYIWQNGKLIPWADAKIHILTHSLHYGGGAFEGIRFYQTDRGPAIFRLADHVKRLFYSSGTLKMTLPYSADEISAAIIEIVKVNKLQEGYIRPLAYYGYGKMGVSPIGNPVDLAIACWPWGAYLPHAAVDIKTSHYIRIHPQSTIVDAKLTGHYVNSILASLELQGTPYHEALFLDNNHFISEGPGENFFIVKNGIVHTPKLGTIIQGITRDTIFKLGNHLGIKVVESDITLEDAYHADEAFFSGTAAEIMVIRSIDDHKIGTGTAGKITAQIKQAYTDLVHGKSTEFANFLTYVE